MSSERLQTASTGVLAKWLWLLAGAALIGCIPDKSCEFTRTCSPASAPDAAPTNSAATTADTSADAASETNSGGETTGLPDAGGGNPIVTCQRSTDCSGNLRYCDEAALVCTECRSNADCKDVARPYCAVLPGAIQDNRCVECLPDTNTCDGVCVDNRCARCDTTTNAGCDEVAPYCTLVEGRATCVGCITSDDCAASPETPVCDDAVCKACAVEAPGSCPAEAPVCVEELDGARCVQCSSPEDCAAVPGAGALCIQERCTTCALGSNEGCPTDTPVCAALVPLGDAGVQYVAPPPASGQVPEEQYLDYEHQCVDCVDDSTCGGKLPGCFQGACVECTENAHCELDVASVCDLETHTCVGCQAVGDCSHQENTPACDIENRTCVPCTAAEDTCGEKACQTVPGPGRYTCSSANKQRTAPCFPCVSDSACQANSHCLLDTFEGEDHGWFCFRKEASLTEVANCADTRVFVDRFDGVSVDGVSGPFCRPRLTSCQGYLHYEEGPVTGNNQQPTCTSDDDCGAPGANDGYCVFFTASSNRCTYACLSSIDCETNVLCGEVTSVSGSTNKVCQVNP